MPKNIERDDVKRQDRKDARIRYKYMIQLSDKFNLRKIFKFTIPSVMMMVVTSIYSVVDGFFVSNFAGKIQFAAVNFIMPVIMMLSCLGFMFGTGGSAIIAGCMGEGKDEKANEVFSQNIAVSFILGLIIAVLGFMGMPFIARSFGAEGELLENSVLYGRMLMCSMPFYILQYEFQALFPTAEKPHLGLMVTVAAGVTNIILDALFCAVFGWGLKGAAAATMISEYIGGGIPLIYFIGKNSSKLRIREFSPDMKSLLRVITNGSSELMSNISMSLVGMLFNIQLLKYAGENGVAAYGVIMYVNFIFISIFIGYSVGIAPVFSFKYGAKKVIEIKELLVKSILIIAATSVAMFTAGQLLNSFVAEAFVGYDAELKQITCHGFRVFACAFLFSGFSIFGSAFFTALGDGLTSALISFLRTLVFEVAALLILPLILGIDGIWMSVVVAELISFIVTGMFMLAKRKKYNY